MIKLLWPSLSGDNSGCIPPQRAIIVYYPTASDGSNLINA